MNNFQLFALILLFATLYSCSNFNQTNKKKYQYKFADLLKSDSVRVKIINKNDTLFEVIDNVNKNESKSVYIFDKENNLRFYGFFTDSLHCKFSEEFDSIGSLKFRYGNPMLEYSLFKSIEDTVLFNVSISSLNKKYNDIKLYSNLGDTIIPLLLYKNENYSNVKVFPFKLLVKKKINQLIIFSSFNFFDSSANRNYFLRDTTEFSNIKLNW